MHQAFYKAIFRMLYYSQFKEKIRANMSLLTSNVIQIVQKHYQDLIYVRNRRM